MKNILLLISIIAIVILIAPNIANATCNGVTICGVNYDCGVSDGVCPEDFSACDKCSTPDPDCGIPTTSSVSGGGGGGREYPCMPDIEMYFINSLSPKETFNTLENRYCTDLHLFELNVNKKVSNVYTSVKLIQPEVIPPEGKVYNYYNVSLEKAPEDAVKTITFRFRVPIDWAKNNSVVKNKFVLYKQERVFWDRLDTSFLSEDESYYYYGATGKSLGMYAIVGQRLSVWDVLEKLSLYYGGEIQFGEVLHTIDLYYSF